MDQHPYAGGISACVQKRTTSPFVVTATTLPIELLVRIFFHNKEIVDGGEWDDFDDPLNSRELSDLRNHVRRDTRTASQVCRHWRAAAIGCSMLWTDMTDFDKRCRTGTYQNWFNIVLGRCKGRSLFGTVLYSHSSMLMDFDYHAGWILLFNNFHNLGSLSISIFHRPYNDEGIELFAQKLRNPAPKLTELLFDVNWDYHSPPHTLSPPFVHPDTHLKRLHLKNANPTVEIARQSFSSLVDLTCRGRLNVLVDENEPLPISQWLEILRETPLLEFLFIEQLGRCKTRVRPGTAPVELARLSKLSLVRDIGSVVDILTYLEFPNAVSLSIHCGGAAPDEESRKMFSYLSQNYGFRSQGRAVELVHAVTDDRFVGIKAYEHEHDLDPLLSLSFSNQDSCEADEGWMSCYYYSSVLEPWLSEQLQHAQHLRYLWGGDVVPKLLLPLKQVRKLSTNDFGHVFATLGPYGRTHTEKNSEPAVSLPNLYHIETIGWSREGKYCRPLQSKWPSILKFIAQRKEAKCPILCLDVDLGDQMNAEFMEFCGALRNLGVYLYNSEQVGPGELRKKIEEILRESRRVWYE